MQFNQLKTASAACLILGAVCAGSGAQEPAKKTDDKTAARLEVLWADMVSPP